MRKPFRLGVSTSSFIHLMPREVAQVMYGSAIKGIPGVLDARQNRLMAGFTRQIMNAVNASEIESVECYDSTVWNSKPLLSVMRKDPKVEFWSVHAPYGYFTDASSPDETTRQNAIEACKDTLEFAAGLRAKVVVCHPGSNIPHDVPMEKRLEFSAETLAEIALCAGERGIKIAIEPMPKTEPGNSLEAVLWIIDRIGMPNVGVNFDVNHLFPAEAIPGLIRQANGRIVNAHISDQDGEEQHWLPFQGNLDWKAVLAAFAEAGYEGPLIYETHIRNAENCEEIVDMIVENYNLLMELAP